MSKLNHLRAILVVGSTIALARSLINDVESRSERLGRDLLIVGTTDDAIEYILAQPKNLSEHGTKKMPWPLEHDIVEVSEEGFTVKDSFGNGEKRYNTLDYFTVKPKKVPPVDQPEEAQAPADEAEAVATETAEAEAEPAAAAAPQNKDKRRK